MTSLDIKLRKLNKIYHENDVLSGIVIVQSKSDLSHQGLLLTVDGSVNLQLSAKSVGVFEAFYNSVKPISLMHFDVELAKPGKMPAGKTEIPFEIPLKAKPNRTLYETYHGVYVSVQYSLQVDMKRSFLNKDLQKQIEFIIEYKDQEEKAKPKPVTFNITPDSLQNVRDKSGIPRFRIKGKFDSTHLRLLDPLTGELCVETCTAGIKSIELQLVRVETCGCAEGYARDATEIQNIQIADGDVCRNLTLPLYMVLPRLFTCPTLITNNFKIEFEVNVVIVFDDDHLITENFPLKLYRC